VAGTPQPRTVPPGAIARANRIPALRQFGSRPEQIEITTVAAFLTPPAIRRRDYPAHRPRGFAFAKACRGRTIPAWWGKKRCAFAIWLSVRWRWPMGLETVHPQVSAMVEQGNSNWRIFRRARRFLRGQMNRPSRVRSGKRGPAVPGRGGREWNGPVKSAGVSHCPAARRWCPSSPRVPGNGRDGKRLRAAGEFSGRRGFATLEKALETRLGMRGDGRIFADTWGLWNNSRTVPRLFRKRRQRILCHEICHNDSRRRLTVPLGAEKGIKRVHRQLAARVHGWISFAPAGMGLVVVLPPGHRTQISVGGPPGSPMTGTTLPCDQ